jgi:tetratricopeptide (TPR) repeat protein
MIAAMAFTLGLALWNGPEANSVPQTADHQAGPVDAAFTGVWRLTTVDEQKETWISTLDIGAHGEYSLYIVVPPQSPAVPEETGTIEARDGRFKLRAKSGRADEGTYVISKDGATIQGSKGKAHLWKRVSENLPPLFASPPAIARAPRLPVTPAAQSYVEGLDLLASGKFGEATAALDKAVEASPNYYGSLLARGIAKIFAERFEDAGADLLAAAKNAPPPQVLEAFSASTLGTSFQQCCGMWGAVASRMGNPKYPENDLGRDIGIWGDYQTQRLPLITLCAIYRKDKAAARARFPMIASVVAQLILLDSIAGWPELGFAMNERARELYARKDYARALELVSALLTKTANPWLGAYHAGSKLHLGGALMARREYTYLATLYPAMPEAYLGRALACARLGDAKRARADLETARKLDAELTKASEQEILDAIRDGGDLSADSTTDRLAALEKAVKDDEPFEKLVDRATLLLRTSIAQRRFGDEAYQEELRRLHQSVREKPGDADRLALFGEFLFRQRAPAGVRIEPASPFVPVRVSADKVEWGWADDALRAALRVNPQQAKALVWRAAGWLELGQTDQAMELLGRVLKIRKDLPEVFDLVACAQQNYRDVKLAKVYDLRDESKIESVTPGKSGWVRSDGAPVVGAVVGGRDSSGAVCNHVWSAPLVHFHVPTPEELALADDLEKAATGLNQFAETCLNACDKLMSDRIATNQATAEDWDYKGRLHERRGKLDEARAAYEKAIEKDPGFIRAHQDLSDVLYALKKPDAAWEESVRALTLRDTNAGFALAEAWNQIEHGGFTLGREFLGRARTIDPADPRTFAFLGVMCYFGAAKEKDAKAQAALRGEAIVSFRVAIAIEAARAQLDAVSLLPEAMGEVEPQEAALTLACKNWLGRLYLEEGDAATALSIFTANTGLALRVNGRKCRDEVYQGKLPFMPAILRPAEDIYTHMAWACVGRANALLGLGKNLEAIQQALMVQSFWESSKRGSAPSPTLGPAILAAEALLKKLNPSFKSLHDKDPLAPH